LQSVVLNAQRRSHMSSHMSHMDEHMSPGPRLEPSRAEFTAASYAAEVKELRNVGSGSFGSAILVEVVATGELFVSKKISLEHMAPDEQTKASNEAALLKSLRHQNITEYLGSFVLGNMLHIVTEYCSGGTLQQAMARLERTSESFEEEEVFDWFLQIGMALEFIHSKMILHRDIKPSNVFLTKRNLVKLGDFGIAKQMDDTSDFAQTCVGTPYYLSPELIEGRPYNQLSDV
jgi:NIMA (never in mitosis gene a)-related kinase